MGYAQQSGYTPSTISQILDQFRVNINAQFNTSYTTESFVGTNHYKYFYAASQLYQSNEIKTSEIFAKLQQYFTIMNALISRPVNTPPGIVEKFGALGYIASVKPMIDADAGKISICVDVNPGLSAKSQVTITAYANLISGTADKITIGATQFTAQSGSATPGAATFQAATSNAVTATSLAAQINAHATAGALVKAKALAAVVYLEAIHGGTAGNAIASTYTNNDANVGATVSATTLTGGTDLGNYAATKLAINTLISQITVLGAVTQGSEVSAIVLSNGQSFDFKYFLPNRIPVGLRLSIVLSENNQNVIASPDATKITLLSNIAARYRLGKNFQPQTYFGIEDAPWASSVTLEWTTDVTNGDIDPTPVWNSTVYDANFNDLFSVDLTRILLVET